MYKYTESDCFQQPMVHIDGDHRNPIPESQQYIHSKYMLTFGYVRKIERQYKFSIVIASEVTHIIYLYNLYFNTFELYNRAMINELSDDH